MNAVADHDPDWSPDGSQIAWVRHESQFSSGPSDVWIMDVDGSNQHKLTDHSDQIVAPAWSPDGSQLAYTRNHAIWIIGADGTGDHRITPRSGYAFGPAWSPDGGRIAFSGSHRTSGWHVDMMRSDGTGTHIVIDLDSAEPAWSPDGSRLAFYACGVGDCGLYQSSDTGKHIRELGRRSGFSDIEPDFRTVPTP